MPASPSAGTDSADRAGIAAANSSTLRPFVGRMSHFVSTAPLCLSASSVEVSATVSVVLAVILTDGVLLGPELEEDVVEFE